MSFICRNCGTKTKDYTYSGKGLSCCPEREPVEKGTTEGKDVEWGWEMQKENKRLREEVMHLKAKVKCLQVELATCRAKDSKLIFKSEVENEL
jgi:hypothetical protein